MVAVGIFEPRSWVVKPETISAARADVKERGGRPARKKFIFARSKFRTCLFEKQGLFVLAPPNATVLTTPVCSSRLTLHRSRRAKRTRVQSAPLRAVRPSS